MVSDTMDYIVRKFDASYKIPGGKFLRVRTNLSGTYLCNPQLSGDFFLMPPERLADVEKFLHGWDLSVTASAVQLTNRLEKFLQREQILFSGIDASAISHAIELIRENAGITQKSARDIQ